MSFATRCRAVQPFDDGPAPQRERGVAADLGFITYHRELPVNDFRYLGTEETLRLDWEDPWFSKFDNRNLWRQYDAPVSAFLYVEHYEVRKEIVLRPKDLEKWVDLGLDGKEVITVEEQPEIKRKVVEFLESKNPVTIDGVPAEGILDRVHFIYRNLRTIGVIVCDSGPAVVVFVARRLRAETAGCRRAHNDGIDRGTYRGLTILPRDRKAHGWGAMWSNLVCTMKKREIEFPDYHTGGQLFAIGSDRRVSPRTRRKGNYTALALKTFIRRLVISLVWPLSAATAQQPASFHPATPQRPTFTTDTSVTTPGTVELELGGFFAENVGALPTSVKFTPDVSGFFHRTEIAVSFDTLSSVSTRGDRDTRFGDTLTVAMRRALYESDGFSFALAPVATFFLRGEDGARLGGTAIAVYGRGANSIVVNLGLTGATSSSLSNPSVQLDLATDFFRSLSDRFTIFSGALYEKASESAGTLSRSTYLVDANVLS